MKCKHVAGVFHEAGQILRVCLIHSYSTDTERQLTLGYKSALIYGGFKRYFVLRGMLVV